MVYFVGTLALLKRERELHVKQNFLNMKLRKTFSFLEEASVSVKRQAYGAYPSQDKLAVP